ncbi:MAG: 1-(5-phosphoribosyl)-5-[(5-phosphoribosylamino) methylideneamino]imidazole-4-carboxamide isomerase [Anaerolineales bacterium]
MSFTIYPAIDLRGGKVVRLKQGDPARQTAYSEDPAETARRWRAAGAEWIHAVNLDSAFGESDAANQIAIQSILQSGAKIQLGGGLRSLDSLKRAFELGVARAVLGTVAVENPALVALALEQFGAERIAIGIDARDGLVRARGWTENSGIAALDLALQMKAAGAQTVIFTDISRDGLGGGVNLSATQELAQRSGLNVIASGGVFQMEDVTAAKNAGLAGVIIGRALYEGAVDLAQALRLQRKETHVI